MKSLNKLMLIGHLGKDPEMRFTPSGKPVTNFSLAVSESYLKDGERKEHTEWVNVVTWGKTAESCNQYLSQGSKVYVEGSFKTNSWEGQDGQKHFKVELNARDVIFLDAKNKQENTEPESTLEPDDVPF